MSLYSLVPVKANRSTLPLCKTMDILSFSQFFIRAVMKNINNNTFHSHRSLEYNKIANTQFLRYWKLFAEKKEEKKTSYKNQS